ncbi:MAG: peroxiredoxin family protein [Propionibacteriaceae bacterium]|nr:peroxiredoxin family protein [Propionibacteriaceae bacterium]
MTQRTRPPAGNRPANHNDQPTQSRRAQLREAKLKEARTRQIRRWLTAAAGLLAVALIAFGLWSARPTGGDTATTAPDFTLPTTDGGSVTLSDLRGGPVILYFNEGAGCGSCTVQMAEIEKNPGFADAGITVLPIVMNTAEQILPDMKTYGVTTPYLLDDGTVSAAYGVLGKGMHEGLPGHGFVLIDADGIQRWNGDYPSMWLDPAELLHEATSRL